MRITGLPGSLREGSFNTRLLRAATQVLPDDVSYEVFDGIGRLPLFNEDLEGDDPHAAVAELNAAIADADAVLIATPEYNHSIPGQLKNALDWASRPFPHNALRAKPAAVIGASTSLFGAVWAQAELRKVLGATGARVLDADLPVPIAQHAFAADGSLRDPALQERLATITELLCKAAAGERQPVLR